MPAVAQAPSHRLARDAVRAAVVGAIATLAAAAGLVVARRIAGGVTAELDFPTLLAALAPAAVVVIGGRILWRRTAGARAARRDELLLAYGSSAALVGWCVACAPPSLHDGHWLAWLPLVGADWLARQAFLGSTPPQAPTADHDLDAPGADDEPRPWAAVQRLTRTRDAAGREWVDGTLLVDFAPGQRTAGAYVGFCPPLAALPDVDVQLGEGPDGTAKVVQALAHGAQFEVRLARPAAEACGAIVEFSAWPSV